MKITVMTGSPHKQGTSFLLADNFIRGAEEAGNEVFRFDCAFKTVHPCIGCEACGKGTSACAFPDDMRELAPHLLEADLIAFITPLYYFDMSAQIKTVIDRFHGYNIQMRGRKCDTVLLVTADLPYKWVMKGVTSHYEAMLHYLGWNDRGRVLALDCGDLEAMMKTDFPEKAYEFGKSLTD
ncbi:MAG: flavodoxin family protein [Eubacteriaceae bacterium]|jgi:multimeric flavodoxin WrbA|nr:flavodoxin family protein [Eubacteriaceae bacterium]